MGRGGDDVLDGRAGNDTLEGGAGADTLRGGLGKDVLEYRSSTAGVTVDLSPATDTASGGHADDDSISGFEHVTGSNHGDTLTGDSEPNELKGLDGDDTLDGGGGKDTLEGGKGADDLDGGAGRDALSYRGSDVGVTVSLKDDTASGGHAGSGDQKNTIRNFERVHGSKYADSLTGGDSGPAAHNELLGRGGNDTLKGGGGNDTLEGGAGADSLDGGAGKDVLEYRSSDAGVKVSLSPSPPSARWSSTVYGGHAEGDTISGIENVTGSAHGDELAGDSGPNELKGLGGNDGLHGNAGDDTLRGGEGTDHLFAARGKIPAAFDGRCIPAELRCSSVEYGQYAPSSRLVSRAPRPSRCDAGFYHGLFGGAGADLLDGGPGLDIVGYRHSPSGVTVALDGTGSGGDAAGDTLQAIEFLYGSAYADELTGNEENNVLKGRDGDDKLWGGEGHDYLRGQNGEDELHGQDGNDWLEGGAEADKLDGGPGVDTVTYWLSDAGVKVSLSPSPPSARWSSTVYGGHAEGDTISEIENVTGSAHGDELAGDSGPNELKGLGGNDGLHGNAGDDTLRGGEGTDHLFGGAGADLLDGGPGLDIVGYRHSPSGVTVALDGTGSGGDAAGDTLQAIEFLYGSAYADELTGNEENNVLKGRDGDDKLWGGEGHDYLRGQNGEDELHGQNGNDTLEGGAGSDSLDGGTGVDTVTYENSDAGVTVDLSPATDTASGGHAAGDTIEKFEHVIGSEHDDELTGDSGPNDLQGRGGGDELTGGAGADMLNGGAGVDKLTGDGGTIKGADKFVFSAASDSPAATPDTILDFSPLSSSTDDDKDQLDLSGLADGLADGLTFIEDEDGAFTSAPGQVRYVHGTDTSDQKHTDVEVDVSGNGSPDFMVRLLGGHYDLAAGDFILS